MGSVFSTFFKENSRIQSIRHVIRPSVSYNIRPSFEKYYDTYIIDANGNTAEYTRFEENFFGLPSRRYSSAIGLQISNNIEAKIKEKDSLATEPRKVTILNNLNLSTSYNLAVDSLRLSPIRMNGGTQLFKNKMNISELFDPKKTKQLICFDEYFNFFKSQPHTIATLVYDIVGLISKLHSEEKIFKIDRLYSNSGFIGINGWFKMSSNGKVLRSPNIYKIKNQNFEILLF